MSSVLIVALGVTAWLGVIVIAVSMCVMAATGDRAMQSQVSRLEPVPEPTPRAVGGRFRGVSTVEWTVDDLAADG